jgi:hypothetical protein
VAPDAAELGPPDPPPPAEDDDPPHAPSGPDSPSALASVCGGADPSTPAGVPVVPLPDACPAPVRRADRRSVALWLVVVLLAALLALKITLAREGTGSEPAEHPPAHGESVRLRGTDRIFLAFGETLYEFPDSYTLCMCTGWHPGVVREIRALPPWPRHVLPSATRHTWMGRTLPVVSDHPVDRTAYVPVGCILTGIPTPETLDSIFGSGAMDRMLEVPDSVLERLPRAFVARGHPLRPAGTLIRGPDNRVRWIIYHGGAMEVTDPSLLATHCRSPDHVVPVQEPEFSYYRPWSTLPRGSGDCPHEPSSAR